MKQKVTGRSARDLEKMRMILLSIILFLYFPDGSHPINAVLIQMACLLLFLNSYIYPVKCLRFCCLFCKRLDGRDYEVATRREMEKRWVRNLWDVRMGIWLLLVISSSFSRTEPSYLRWIRVAIIAPLFWGFLFFRTGERKKSKCICPSKEHASNPHKIIMVVT